MRNIIIDPPYKVLEGNKLFALNDPILNRDDQLLYFFRLKESIVRGKNAVNTADYLKDMGEIENFEYYSFGNYSRFLRMSPGADLRAFILMEPPSAFPYIYKALPAISNRFQSIYVHNVEGDGFSIKDVNKGRLKKFYHPIPYRGVLEQFWRGDRVKKILLINGNHRPLNSSRELYSFRIKFIAELQKTNSIDLYGRGWNKWWSGNSRWLPYWLNRKAILSAWRGSCNSKFELMGCYEYALCIENTEMLGYISEKIFDCFYSGVIPIYYGAPDIDTYIPNDCYINLRHFSNCAELIDRLNSLTNSELDRYRLNIKNFMSSKRIDPFYNSLESIFDIRT